MTAQISRLLISSFHKNPNSPLTKRESEILDQFSLGKTRKAVAETLFIDQETVKSHLKNIYLKFQEITSHFNSLLAIHHRIHLHLGGSIHLIPILSYRV